MSLLQALGLRRAPARPALGWDFHCHLLPGVDDGVRTLDEARAAIAGLRRLGYRGGVLTPHIYPGVYDNDTAGLRAAFAEFRARIGEDYALWLAAEYHVTDALFERIAEGDLLYAPLGDRRLVLVEFPYLMPAPRGIDALATLTRAGYQPVLAHAERYRYLHTDPEPWLARIARHGTWVQCNIGSLSGLYGEGPRALAEDLLQRGLPVLWGTDLHRPRQIERYIAPGLECLGGLGRLNPALDALEEAYA